MYYHGQGVPQDYTEALRWERKSAEQGYTKAEYGVGFLYFHGKGVPQDYTEALRWICKAADQGYVYAQGELGYMYETGKGVPQDYAEALRWYHKAADQGDAYSENKLGLMYYKGQVVQQDNAESARWYRKAAVQGDALGESGIGFMLWYGYGVPQDRVEANRWFQKAADQGDEYAMRAISRTLTTGTKYILIFQLIAGLFFTTNFLSLNIFESGKNLRSLRQKVITGTGVLILFTTGLSWYGYTHYKIRCISCGLTTFTVLKWLLNMIIIALLIYIALSKEPEAQESEVAAEEVNSGNEDNSKL
jgi:TPR repeat protein